MASPTIANSNRVLGWLRGMNALRYLKLELSA
jgi:hypothetical protein